jgi:acetyltransferase-like isoleucine patch superfamily enzyme
LERLKKVWRRILVTAAKHSPNLYGALMRVQFRGVMAKRQMSGYAAGPYTYGNPKVFDSGHHDAVFKVGAYTSIGPEVAVLLGSEHDCRSLTTYPFAALWAEARNLKIPCASKGDIIVGNDCWIGARTTILSGVTIGDGCIIGACSVVTRDLPPYSVAAGNPCRVLRMRFEPKDVEALLRLRWWDWPREVTVRAIPHLVTADIKGLFEFARKEGLAEPDAHQRDGLV